ncbi:MAG: permease-like cell division protein FtsX [Thermoanaerobaculia bacterium]
MTLLQALVYFAREAGVSLVRSFKVSLLAILTIGVSLFLAGMLLMVSGNLSASVAEWRGEARLVVYLDAARAEAALAELTPRLRAASWVEDFRLVPAREAEERFARAFPSLADLVGGGAAQTPLPPSLEVRWRDPRSARSPELDRWLGELRATAGVEMVDDDRDWIAQVETALALVNGVGVVLTAVLLGASIFTIASVVRLTSFLYRDEIAIMRLVGATEFFIRGPFYCEGVLQGMLGAALAAGGLWATHLALARRVGDSVIASIVGRRFLAPRELGLLVLLGATAGLVGALLSLGREALRPSAAPGAES